MTYRNLKIYMIAFLSLCFYPGLAGDSVAVKYPVAVLVQLRSEHNRLEALKRDKMWKEMEEVEKDAKTAAASMIGDFRENFNYCPVYYFMDTNFMEIKNKHFDGILMNEHLTPEKNVIINSASENYVIVYFGYPATQPHTDDIVPDSMKFQANSGEAFGKGLIIDNDKFEQISYVYKLGYSDIFVNRKKKRYFYTSDHYDIEYFPLAGQFMKKLGERDKSNLDKIKISRNRD